MRTTVNADRDAVLTLIDPIAAGKQRTLVAIAGPPGSGKSTLAEAVVAELNRRSGQAEEVAALLPMDGFHLDNEVLAQRHLLARKGAPQTFDAYGLTQLLSEVKAGRGDVRFPRFDRSADRVLVDAGLLRAATRIVVVEGNYLLLDEPPWSALSGLFDASVFLRPPMETLRARLMSRWLDHGYSEAQARQKTEGNDLINADYVLTHSRPADLTLADNDA